MGSLLKRSPGDRLIKLAGEKVEMTSAASAEASVKKVIDQMIKSSGAPLEAVSIDVIVDPKFFSKSVLGNSQGILDMVTPEEGSTPGTTGTLVRNSTSEINTSDTKDTIDSFVGKIELKVDTSVGKCFATIPFKVSGGVLLPFERIDFFDKTFVATAQNIKKIVTALNVIQKNPEVLNPDSNDAFVGMAKFDNPQNDMGNLRDVLNIRYEGGGGSILGGRVASQALDTLLEKTAGDVLFPLTSAFFNAAEKLATETVLRAELQSLEKFAADIDEIAMKAMSVTTVVENLKALDWKNVKDVADRTDVRIADTGNNQDGIVLKNAKVFKNRAILLPDGNSDNARFYKPRLFSTKDIVVIDNDNRVKTLYGDAGGISEQYLVATKGSELVEAHLNKKTLREAIGANWLHKDKGAKGVVNNKFLFVTPSVTIGPLDFEGVELSQWNEGDLGYTAGASLSGNSSGLTDDLSRIVGDLIRVEDLFNQRSLIAQKAEFGEIVLKHKKGVKDIQLLNGVESRAEWENLLRNDEQMRSLRNVSVNSLIILVDFENPEINLYPVTGNILTPVTALQDLIIGQKDPSVNEKVAADETKITLQKPKPDQELYNVIFSKGVFNTKRYDGLPKDQILAIMRRAGVPESDIVTMMGVVDGGIEKVERSLIINFDALDGTEQKNKISQIMSNLSQNLLHSNDARKILDNVVTEQASGLLSSAPNAFRLADALSTVASEAEELAGVFEKVAIETHSKDFLQMAKLMVVASRLDNCVKTASTHDVTFDLRPIRGEMKKIRPLIAKSASDLFELQKTASMNSVEVFKPEVFTYTFRTLDRLQTYSNML